MFIARGVGAVIGAVVSSKLYLWMRGNNVMSIVLLLLTGILMYMPFITSVITLHAAFFVMGLCTAITDTGCQIMTRKLHGSKAGPWLGANTVVFGISGALVPLIGYMTGSLFIQYVILASVSCMTAAFLIILPAPEKYEGLLEVSKPLFLFFFFFSRKKKRRRKSKQTKTNWTGLISSTLLLLLLLVLLGDGCVGYI